MDQPHFESLLAMYQAAPVNQIYQPTMSLTQGCAEIEIKLSDKYHHAGGSVHGSVYFKMLDDAAYFAASTLEKEFFIVTASFTTYMTRPVSFGVMKAVGQVVNQSKMQFIAESVVYDSRGREVGRGNGIFVRSKLPLSKAEGYQ